MTNSKMGLFATLNITVSSAIKVNVAIFIVMLSVIVLSVVMLNVVLQSVVAPFVICNYFVEHLF